MSARLKSPVSLRLSDADTDRVVRNHDERIREIQAIPVVQGVLVRDVELPSSTEVPVAHGLGRNANCICSPARGSSASGAIEEVRTSNYDLTKFSILRANGFGATVFVDVWCF